MEHEGGCHCGAVRYTVSGDPQHVAICHCSDCRKAAGAPIVSWAAFSSTDFTVTKGAVKTRNSSGDAFRSFCPDCGTGLWFINETVLPGLVDVQTATLDDPGALVPQAQIQVADRIEWMKQLAELPEFERFPGQ